MGFIIGVLTLLMVLICVILILLVLVQLPKKEAGAGLAFGGAASDALFGAGSGTVLTKVTKYAAASFFVLAIVLSVLQSHYHRRSGVKFEQMLQQGAASAPLSTQPSPSPEAAAPGPQAGTVPPVTTTSAPPVSLTNPPAK